MSDSKRAPQNTAAAHPLVQLLNMMDGPQPVEKQEAQGQQSFVHSDTLPSKMPADARTELESRGVVFGEAVEGDPMFCYATLPDGWEKRPTEHSMWNDLVNADGETVAAIFYKAAFYDRDAFLRLASP